MSTLPELLPLVPQQRPSRANPAPRSSWMLRGIFDKFLVREGVLFDTHEVLQPSSMLRVPACMRNACFIAHSSSLYFTIPEAPNTVYAQFVPSPITPLPAMRIRGARAAANLSSNAGSEARSGHLEDAWRDDCEERVFEGEVIALAPCDRWLFVLVRKRARDATDDSFWVHRLPTHPENAFHLNDKAVSANLTLPAALVANATTLSFVVVMPIQQAFEIYVAGPGSLLRGRFAPDQRIVPDPFPGEIASQGEFLALTRDAPYDPTNKPGRGDVLLAANANRGTVYSIQIRSNQHTVNEIARMPDGFGPTAPFGMARLHLNISYIEPANQSSVEPQARVSNMAGQRIPMILIANRQLAQIWSINQLDRDGAVAPLIGGSGGNLKHGAPVNLYDVSIGSVDCVCPLHDVGFLFGARDHGGWGALLTPTMVRTIGILGPSKFKFHRLLHSTSKSKGS